MKNKKLVLILILLLAAFLRFYRLGQMPYGITNDEAGYIYNSYSISKTLKDVNGKFLPFSFNLEDPFSPVPIYLNAIFIKIFGLSIFAGRFLYATLGVGCVLLLFLLAEELFKSTKIALTSALVLAISPWHLHISRSAYEAGVALFFFLLAFLVFRKNVKKGNINWSLPLFILAFYSYHATKIFFIFFVFVLAFTHRSLFKRKKELAFFLAVAFLVIFSFLIIGKREGGMQRGGLFLYNDMEAASEFVNLERRKSSAPFIIRQVFNNKPLYFLRVMREKYLNAYSLQFLFLYGETSGLAGIYGTFFRGVMYIIELPLLLLGLFTLVQKFKKERNILLLSLLIAPLATTFTTDASYVMRTVMMIPFLCLLVGLGIISFTQIISIARKKQMMVIFVGCYLFLVTSYLYQYHFRYSIYGAESWFRSSRELATLIRDNRDRYNRINVVDPGQMFILQYGVFANLEPEKIQETWETWNEKETRELENISFSSHCIDVEDEALVESLPPGILYVVPEIKTCHKQATPSSVIKDYGEPLRTIWKIYSTE